MEILFELERHLMAMTNVCVDSVVIPTGADPNSIFARMYYDCTDPEEIGENIVAERFNRVIEHYSLKRCGSDDAIESYNRNVAIYNLFNLIPEQVSKSQNAQFVNTIDELVTKLTGYAFFIRNHQEWFGDNSFLDYPHSRPEMSKLCRDEWYVEINTTPNFETYMEEVENLKKLNEKFDEIILDEEQLTIMYGADFSWTTDTRSGDPEIRFDTSTYRINLNATKTLLDRALGLDLSGLPVFDDHS